MAALELRGLRGAFGDLGVRLIAERQLAWALPFVKFETRPAAFRGWWSSGHFLVTFLHDAQGEIVSARASTD